MKDKIMTKNYKNTMRLRFDILLRNLKIMDYLLENIPVMMSVYTCDQEGLLYSRKAVPHLPTWELYFISSKGTA
jgi:hypothetical protein